MIQQYQDIRNIDFSKFVEDDLFDIKQLVLEINFQLYNKMPLDADITPQEFDGQIKAYRYLTINNDDGGRHKEIHVIFSFDKPICHVSSEYIDSHPDITIEFFPYLNRDSMEIKVFMLTLLNKYKELYNKELLEIETSFQNYEADFDKTNDVTMYSKMHPSRVVIHNTRVAYHNGVLVTVDTRFFDKETSEEIYEATVVETQQKIMVDLADLEYVFFDHPFVKTGLSHITK